MLFLLDKPFVFLNLFTVTGVFAAGDFRGGIAHRDYSPRRIAYVDSDCYSPTQV